MPAPKCLLNTQKEMESRRILARMLRSNARKKEIDVRFGHAFLRLLPGGKRKRGQWVEERVTEIPIEHSIAVNTERRRKAIAVEDLRTLPR